MAVELEAHRGHGAEEHDVAEVAALVFLKAMARIARRPTRGARESRLGPWSVRVRSEHKVAISPD